MNKKTNASDKKDRSSKSIFNNGWDFFVTFCKKLFSSFATEQIIHFFSLIFVPNSVLIQNLFLPLFLLSHINILQKRTKEIAFADMVLADSVERLYVQERNKKMEKKGADEHQENCSETISEQLASSVASSVLESLLLVSLKAFN